MRLKNEEGFTLVELIVVMVILTILTGIMVPSVIGWIDKAREQQVLVNARTLFMATQTIVTEEYVQGNTDFSSSDGDVVDEIITLSGMEQVDDLDFEVEGGTITFFQYEQDDWIAVYEDGEWEASKLSTMVLSW